MNALDEELTEALRGERYAVGARMLLDRPAIANASRRRNRWLVAVPVALTVIAGFAILGIMGGGDEPMSVATGPLAQSDKPAAASAADGVEEDVIAEFQAATPSPIMAAQPGQIDAADSADTAQLMTVRIVPVFRGTGLTRPMLEDITASSSLSSNSEEIYYVNSDGTVDLPTVRDRDVFHFVAPIPGTPDCRWSSNPHLLPTASGLENSDELTELGPEFTPICGQGDRLPGGEPDRAIIWNIVFRTEVNDSDAENGESSGFDAGALSVQQLTGYESADEVRTITPTTGSTWTVHGLATTSLLVVSGVNESQVGPYAGCMFEGIGLIPAASPGSADAEVTITVEYQCDEPDTDPALASTCDSSREPSPGFDAADNLMDRLCAGEFDVRAGPAYRINQTDALEGLALHARPDASQKLCCWSTATATGRSS